MMSTNPNPSPSDLRRDAKCDKCGLISSMCQCDLAGVTIHSEKFRAFLSVETTGKNDHVRTVIEKLPKSEPFLKVMTKVLTAECRVQGNYRLDARYGIIEIFGDKRIAIRSFFEKEKIPYVG